MARPYVCDGCAYQQETPLPFQVTQRLDELDDDGAQVEVVFDMCSAQCLSDFAMGLSLDFPEGDTCLLSACAVSAPKK